MKSKDISKYDLDWQVFRVNQKKLPDIDSKLKSVHMFFRYHKNIADRERVLNYLEGLAIAYRGEERQLIRDFAADLAKMRVSQENRIEFDPSKYTLEELMEVVKDLFARNKKWLLKGYRHEEQINFLRKLLVYCKDNKRLQDLDELVRKSKEIPNTHKFLY